MSVTAVRSRYLHRAHLPREAWKGGREPRWRIRRKDAVTDLVEGLRRYLERKGEDRLLFRATDGELIRSETTDRFMLEQWVTFTARLFAGYGCGRAPDGSEWGLRRRWELR